MHPAWTGRRAGIALAVASLFAFPQESAPQDDAAARRALATEIRALTLELDRGRLAAVEMRAAHRDAVDTLHQQIERLEASVRGARGAAEAEAGRERALQQEVEGLATRLDALQSASERWVAAAQPVVTGMLARLDSSSAWNRAARVGSLRAIADGLATGDATERLEALARWPLWLAEELSAARQVRLTGEPVLVEGGARRIDAWHVSLGLLGAAFVSEDGREVGVGQRGPRAEWDAALPPADAQAWRDAVRVLRDQLPPQVLALPLPSAAMGDR